MLSAPFPALSLPSLQPFRAGTRRTSKATPRGASCAGQRSPRNSGFSRHRRRKTAHRQQRTRHAGKSQRPAEQRSSDKSSQPSFHKDISAESSGSAEAAGPFAPVANELLFFAGDRAIALVLLALAAAVHAGSAALRERAEHGTGRRAPGSLAGVHVSSFSSHENRCLRLFLHFVVAAKPNHGPVNDSGVASRDPVNLPACFSRFCVAAHLQHWGGCKLLPFPAQPQNTEGLWSSPHSIAGL